MSEVGFRVETISRLAQWKTDSLASCNYRRSDPFKIGIWNWHISIEKSRCVCVRLFPEPSRLSKDQPPIASFAVRIMTLGGTCRVLTYREIIDKVLKSSEDFVWPVELPFHGKFIIEVDFMDLKVAGPNDGEPCSIWSTQGTVHSQAQQCALNSLTCMLSNGLHADVTINTAKGRIGAHRAILAARSPVFKKMFGHGSNEEESSTIDMEEMSIEACRALLGYIYGCIHYDEFQKHRLALLRAADKYDIGDLKEACEESLLDDINCKNVLGRLQNASLYHLPQLKQGCMKYLIDFGKVFDLCEEFNMFLQCADRDLIVEIFHELLNVWKGC